MGSMNFDRPIKYAYYAHEFASDELHRKQVVAKKDFDEKLAPKSKSPPTECGGVVYRYLVSP
jgi:hypothetical protein